jgi:uncharacterized protein (UPF0303 family)
MITAPSVEDLERQEAMLVFPRFSEDTAWEIGTALVAAARRVAAPVVVDIRTPDRTLFHAALPGSAPDNDHWARRKSNLTLRLHQSSLRAGRGLAAKGASVGSDLGLDPLNYAAHGGSFPIRVANVGVIGAITVSGLVSEEDHAMIVTAIRAHLDL